MIDKKKILKDIHHVISESVKDTVPTELNAGLNMKGILDEMKSKNKGNASFVSFLEPYITRIASGEPEEMLAESFLSGMKIYADNFTELQKPYDMLKKKISESADNIFLVNMYENISEGFKPEIKPLLLKYAYGKNFGNKIALLAELEKYTDFDNNIAALYEHVMNVKPGEQPDMKICSSENLNESKKVQNGGKEIDIKNTMGRIEAILDEDTKETEAKSTDFHSIDNGIGLRKAVNEVMSSPFTSNELKGKLREYDNAMDAGCREEMLYESFISLLDSVSKENAKAGEVSRNISESVKKNQTSIILTRCLEEMNQNDSYYYIVPLIESNVTAYQTEPTAVNRNILINQLYTFEGCPYVSRIITAVNNDNARAYGPLLGESAQDSLSKSNFITESIYSPVEYIKENECVFSADGNYYVKKGDNISRLSKTAIPSLSENFVILSRLVNQPQITINEDNSITYMPKDGKKIEIRNTTSGNAAVFIGENMETPETLKDKNSMFIKYNDFDPLKFETACFLAENFDKIGKIDFGVRISPLNEHDNYADIFHVKNGDIFIETGNLNEDSHVFYRNVKPLQANSIINEYFKQDISGLFKDMAPDRNNVKSGFKKINESYKNRIDKLLETKQKFTDTLPELNETDAKEVLKTIRNIDHDISESRKNWLKFQVKAEYITEGKKDKADELKKQAEAENDGSEDLFDGSEDNFNELDFDGSENEFNGSENDFENEDFTSSDGDILTQPIDDGSEEDFDTDPFKKETAAENPDDMSDTMDYYADDNTGNGSESDFMGDDSQDDPFNKDEYNDQNGENTDDAQKPETPADKVLGPSADDSSNPEDKQDTVPDNVLYDYPNFKIVKIDFDQNVRTGEKKSSGNAIVVIPWIDDEGNKTSRTNSIDFYITTINGEKSVILNTEGMSVEMYKALTDAIEKSSDFSESEPSDPDSVPGSTRSAESEKKVVPNPEDTVENKTEFTPSDTDTEDKPAEGTDPKDNEDVPEVKDDIFDAGSEDVTNITMQDDIAPHGLEFPEYSDGDTDIEAKAPQNSDPDAIPENKTPIMDIKATYESRNGKKFTVSKDLNKSVKPSDNSITESELDIFGDVAEPGSVDEGDENTEESDNYPDDDSDNEKEIIDVRKDFDPISLIGAALKDYDEDGDIEINDYNIDGKDISTIGMNIGGKDLTFIDADSHIYVMDTSEFDRMDSMDDIQSFIDDYDGEDVPDDDIDKIGALLTDTIRKYSGDDWSFEEIPDEDETNILKSDGGKEEPPIEEDVKVRLKKK